MSSPRRPVTLLAKDDVLPGLFASWDAIERVLVDMAEGDWDLPSPLPVWQVRDIVAHIVGTESMLLGIATPQADVDVRTLDHVHNDIGAANEHWVRHLRGESGAAMLDRLRDVTARRRDMLTKMIPEAWDALTQTPAGPDTYGRFMRVRIFDCWMHEQDIRDALNRPSADADLTGPDTRLALDEVQSSMGFVVGKLGRAPEGARVLIELTGPAARTIRVAVNGRAAAVDDFDHAPPTIVIRLDALQFTRLCGGRPMTTSRPEGIDYEGDAEAGRRIVENLAYVI